MPPMEKQKNSTGLSFPPATSPLALVADKIRTCIQCGTCSGSCPNSFAMDYSPRRMWRMVLLGQKEAIFKSKTFSLCSTCYYCTLRCPRGLPLTEAIGMLKRVAADEKIRIYKQSTLFYKNFIKSVRRHGRVRELEFMSFYFVEMKNPMIPLRFASLGMKLMAKRKVPFLFPSLGKRRLEAIFRKVEELEGGE